MFVKECEESGRIELLTYERDEYSSVAAKWEATMGWASSLHSTRQNFKKKSIPCDTSSNETSVVVLAHNGKMYLKAFGISGSSRQLIENRGKWKQIAGTVHGLQFKNTGL